MGRKLMGPVLWAALALVLLHPGRAGAATHAGPLLQLRTLGRMESDLGTGASIGATLFQPAIGGWLDNEHMALEAQYSTDLVAYPRAGDVPRVPTPNHRAHGDQMFELDERTNLHFAEIGERVTDPTSLSRMGVARSFGETSWLSADASVDHQVSRRLTLVAGYHGDLASYQASALQDGMVNAPYVWARWAATRFDTLGLRYKAQFFDDFGGPNGTSHEPSLTWSHRLGRVGALELSAGPAIYQRASGTTMTVPQGEIALRRQTPWVTLTASYGRQLLGATGIPGAVWSDLLQGYANIRFSHIVALHLGAGVFRNGVGPAGEYAMEGAAGEAAFSYFFTPNVAGQLSWTVALQRPGLDTNVEPISRNIISAGVAINFDGGRVPR